MAYEITYDMLQIKKKTWKRRRKKITNIQLFFLIMAIILVGNILSAGLRLSVYDAWPQAVQASGELLHALRNQAPLDRAIEAFCQSMQNE